MNKFIQHTGKAAPLDRANVDTDMIIPKQFLKSIKRSGFGVYLFDEIRYLDEGVADQDCSNRPLNPEFILNQARYQNASVLLARVNFGCGSSREHAPWALEDYGFRAVVAPSFADIFYNNCFKNGLLPVVLSDAIVEQLFNECAQHESYEINVDLEQQLVITPSGEAFAFDVEPFRKHCLINGLDDIDLSLENVEAIKSFEEQHRKNAPWLFGAIKEH